MNNFNEPQIQILPVPNLATADSQGITNSSGNTTIHQIQALLSAHFNFNFNVVTSRLLFKFKTNDDSCYQYISDYELNSILCWIKKTGISCSKETLRMILTSSYVPVIDPYKQYVESLPDWDGEDYILQLANSVQTTDNEHFEKCLRKWLIAMLASWYYDDLVNHTALIFSGKQGIGKTRWFRSIIPRELSEFVYSGYIQTKDREVNVKVSECSLIIMDELENLSSNNLEAIKALITQDQQFMRRAYCTLSQSFIRRASFAGTVNNSQFLHDITGNRRFLCFEATSINIEHNIPLNQLFSQAWYLLGTGFQYWLDVDDIAELELKNNDFRFVSPEEEMLDTFFDVCEDSDNVLYLPTTAIVEYIRERSSCHFLSIQRMGRILASKNFIRKKFQNRYVWLLKPKEIVDLDK